MRITKIEPQKKRPGRKNIYADGEFVAGVSDETLVRLALRSGDELTEEKLKVLLATEELFTARHAALRFLSHRPRTVREVRDKLREKEFGDEEIAATIQQLQQAGLLNDQEFARMYVRDAIVLRPQGRIALRNKLLLLGIDRSIVDSTLDDTFKETSQETLALEAAEKFMKRVNLVRGKEDVYKLRQKISAYLARRGFSWEIIAGITKQILPNQSQEAEE